ncbi:MAG: efflux transporter outer membrane subunit, partial [Smithella sp.]
PVKNNVITSLVNKGSLLTWLELISSPVLDSRLRGNDKIDIFSCRSNKYIKPLQSTLAVIASGAKQSCKAFALMFFSEYLRRTIIIYTAKPILATMCILLFLGLIGCAVGPDFEYPKPPSIERYTFNPIPESTISADGKTQRFEPNARIISEWWKLFNSPVLNKVIKDALENNQNLQAAQANLRQSQNLLRAGYGVFYPQLDATAEASRQQISSPSSGGFFPSSIFNLFTLSAAVSYTLDIFGGQRRTVESLGADVDYQRAIAWATYINLSANVVNTVIARAGYQEQINATQELIKLQQEQIKITDARVRAGLIPYVNIVTLQSQLAAYEATLPPLQQKINQSQHLLATLMGCTPAECNPQPVELAALALPGKLPITLPSKLVRQRPDILAAEAQLHSASANIGVATAALFPSFTLSGTYGVSSNTAGDLFKNDSVFWNFGANATAPLFRGGTLWFRRKAAIDAYHVASANYRQTALSAFAQIADTLRALEHDAESVKAQLYSLDKATESLQLIQKNYEAGLANYVQVLIVDIQFYQARIGYIQAQTQRLQDTVALFTALGGGWWNKEDGIMNEKKVSLCN